jgi:hypothetical protein
MLNYDALCKGTVYRSLIREYEVELNPLPLPKPSDLKGCEVSIASINACMEDTVTSSALTSCWKSYQIPSTCNSRAFENNRPDCVCAQSNITVQCIQSVCQQKLKLERKCLESFFDLNYWCDLSVSKSVQQSISVSLKYNIPKQTGMPPIPPYVDLSNCSGIFFVVNYIDTSSRAYECQKDSMTNSRISSCSQASAILPYSCNAASFSAGKADCVCPWNKANLDCYVIHCPKVDRVCMSKILNIDYYCNQNVKAEPSPSVTDGFKVITD